MSKTSKPHLKKFESFKVSKRFIIGLLIALPVGAYLLLVMLLTVPVFIQNHHARSYIEGEYSKITFTAPMQFVEKNWLPGQLLSNAPTWIYTYKPLASPEQLAQGLKADLSAAGYKETYANDLSIYASNPNTHLNIEVNLPTPAIQRSNIVVIRVTYS